MAAFYSGCRIGVRNECGGELGNWRMRFHLRRGFGGQGTYPSYDYDFILDAGFPDRCPGQACPA